MQEIKPQHEPIRENEILLKENHVWLHFARPYRVFSVLALDRVLPALHEIEQEIKLKGWYAAGFLSYEAASAFDPALLTSVLAPLMSDGSQHSVPRVTEFPYLWFGLYPKPHAVTLPKPEKRKEILNWLPTVERETYNSSIDHIKQRIAYGRTYQVNYTMRLQADFFGDSWDFFLHLAQNQNLHAAYLNTGRYVICSASPELFFQLDGNTITCRPMKGTAQRGHTTAEDRQRSEWLNNSEKNRAENVMIVDMVRNDLGRIAATGSVRVPALFQLERYPTLWQMTSTVIATTHASLTEIFRALFPCASVTGAPKVSTMQIIAELENTPRKIYTGSIGYVAPQRKAKFNVAIRTVLVDRQTQKAEYGVGGGIVWDSTSSDEYAEALLKARVLTEQQPVFSLLETMLWTPKAGFFLREKHLARMLDSAGYFGFPVAKEELEALLEKASSNLNSPQRARILLDPTGELQFESTPIECAESLEPLNACLAKRPIDSGDIFLYHKTTQRNIYEMARVDCEEFDDVLLYNELGELTEFTLGNLIVEIDDQLCTPPISCGVLPGTFRAYLLETDQVLERIIPVERLNDCRRIFRVNSVRRWQEVEVQRELNTA